ncbi:hypothetical protein O3W44_01550 [Pantoea sp. LMR881]|uniref:hypothetical protein n=1 Tax=Pantoea sp. LMR881 TaxID=3014336 RepID=UPI0022AFA9C7|nr:hypothetical protein [Pantoea sp. LMR881]MCZ4057810.1 hypothetical protein [Pantoea sp. LMR881]MCZ4058054.1 hypothetical protein [Pantoea sp. LMR881]
MKIIWNALLHLSAYAAQKLYGERVAQVDVWLESGKQLMLMDRDESEKLVRVSRQLRDEWTEQEKEDLRLAIHRIREHEKEQPNA